MTFKAYDIFSSLIPGYIFLIAMLEFLGLPFDKDMVVPYTALAFLIGFIMNTLGSWFEGVYFFTWGGKPSSKLLLGKSIWKIRVYNHAALKAHLTQAASTRNPTTDELFSIAFRTVTGEKDTRIEDFNSIYAFARTLFTTSLIGGIMMLREHHNDWRYYAIIVPVVFVLWLRTKQRAYYFSKEVLNVYSKKYSL
jgi:hypothetical protein